MIIIDTFTRKRYISKKQQAQSKADKINVLHVNLIQQMIEHSMLKTAATIGYKLRPVYPKCLFS